MCGGVTTEILLQTAGIRVLFYDFISDGAVFVPVFFFFFFWCLPVFHYRDDGSLSKLCTIPSAPALQRIDDNGMLPWLGV